jgi:hypothetical protein
MNLERLLSLQRDLNQIVTISPRLPEFQKRGIFDISEIQAFIGRTRADISELIASEIKRVSKISGIDPKTQNTIVLFNSKR